MNDDLLKQAHVKRAAIRNCQEGIKLEQEALADRRLDKRLIEHNVDSYRTSIAGHIRWLNAHGFPVTLEGSELQVGGLEP